MSRWNWNAKSAQLSAVTGPARVEYFVPASVADKIGGTGNYAFCYPNVEKVLLIAQANAQFASRKAARTADEKARIENLRNYGYDEKVIAAEAKKREAKAKREAKSGNVFAELAEEIKRDVERLRKAGVRGNIPVCINRASGKRGSERPRPLRRATAIHERFHANARRVEVDAGIDTPGACWAQVEAALAPDLTPKMRVYSLTNYASSRKNFVAEEILARLEEIRTACTTKRRDSDCDTTINDITKHMPAGVAEDFVTLTQSVARRYSNPLNVMRAGIRACAKGAP